MINSTVKRPTPNKSGTGIKAMILAASIGITLGGWGVLAAGQFANTTNPTATTAQSAPASVRQSAQNQQLRQVNAPAQQFSPIARTRSSR
jgi:hypothetical protein